MDGITESVVLVLGYPIAGNPAQFALERSFHSLDLDWRVLSCEVSPQQIDQAVDGADVLGFRGLLLDRGLVEVLKKDNSESGNCFFRDPQQTRGWQCECALTQWLEQAIETHFKSMEKTAERLLCIGPTDARFPASVADQQSQSPIAWAPAEAIENADLIVVTERVDVDEWPDGESTQLVIDLSASGNDANRLRERGFQVIDSVDIQVGILIQSIWRWTKMTPSTEVVTEAIEEYLAV